MPKDLTINVLNTNFELSKKTDSSGVEFWSARDLMSLLGYSRWENFLEVINKSKQSCINSGETIQNHFRDVTKMISIGRGAERYLKDLELDRYACYLIAQNGNPAKPEIAFAQTYFAIQTRKQEVFEKLEESDKRLFIRNEVITHNKKLFTTAKASGVTQFGTFNDAGYKGLYGKSLSQLEKDKGIGKGELLDRAGTTELAANLFRITQTDEKLRKDRVKGQREASRIHNMVGGKVRQTIKDIGGVLPEKLPLEKHIRLIKKEKASRLEKIIETLPK